MENKTEPLVPVEKRNPVELATVAAAKINPLLDELLSSMSVQFHNYLKHHWIVEGPLHRDMHLFFDDSYRLTLNHLDAIAERMTVIGGVPSSSPRTHAARSFVEIEGDDEIPLRSMVENDLQNEQTIIAKLREAIRTCTELGDFGTETLLKRTLAEREEQAHHLDHYLVKERVDKPSKS